MAPTRQGSLTNASSGRFLRLRIKAGSSRSTVQARHLGDAGTGDRATTWDERVHWCVKSTMSEFYEQPDVEPHEPQTKHDPARCITLPQL
jgi:hypothetical protein